MTKKSRYFLAGSAVVLLAGLGVGTVAYLRYHEKAGVPAGLPAELRYVPADAQLVAYADVKTVMASDMRKELERMTTGRRGQQQMHEFAGIDLEKDVNHVVAFMRADTVPAGGNATQQPPRVLLLAQGTFDQARVEQFMKDHGGVVEDYHGKHLVIRRAPPVPPQAPQAPEPPTPPSAGKASSNEKVPSPSAAVPDRQQIRRAAPEMAIGFVQPDVIAVGLTELVRQALDAPPSSAANITTNTDLMGLMRDEASANAWVVGQFDAVSRRMGLPAVVRAQVPPLRMVSASAHIDGGVKATLKAQTADAAAADQLRDVVRGAISFARLQSSAPPQLQEALKTVELGGTGTNVQLSFIVTPDMLRTLHPPPPPPPPAAPQPSK